jgi:hypothetical protein
MLPSNCTELAKEVELISARAAWLWNSAEHPCMGPAEGGWSMAQCFSHLAVSTNAYLPTWRQAFGNPGALRRIDSPLRLDMWGRLLIWFLEPPPKLRFRTRPAFEVSSSPAALEEFLLSQHEFSSVIEQSRGFALDRIRICSAYDSRLKYSVWSSFLTTVAHQRRHLWQAEKTLSKR